MKRIVAFCLLSIMLLSLTPRFSTAAPMKTAEPAAPAEPPPAAAAAAPVKDGYTLIPLLYGASGVDISSAFLLTAPDTASIDEITRAVSIDGQPAPSVTQNAENGFLITPAAALSPNSLYIFRFQQEGKDDITWAFQTCKKFQITSNYPYNQATNVPKNSGIEITFSDEGYTPIDSYFSISPHVDGRFEYHKNTAVFVPRSLDYRTVYTVTIKSGIKLNGTNEELRTDHVFSFETEPEPGYSPPSYFEYIYFFNSYVELPTIEPPRIDYSLSYPRGAARPAPQINVYKFRSADQAANAVHGIKNKPYWSRFSGEDDLIDTRALNRVMTFTAAGKDENRYYDTLELPDKLAQGFYLIDAALGGSHAQMIIQISDLPVQVVADNDKAVVWVNDIITGGAAARATVYDVKSGLSYRTDANGVAVIDRTLSTDGSEQFNVTSAGGRTCVWIHTPDYYYYYYGYGFSGAAADEAYWTTLQLDRTLFKRGDEVSFCGFVQARKNSEEISSVTAVLTQAYGYGRYGERDILHRQAVQVRNGSYSDEMKLPNLSPGAYCLSVYHGDIVLGSTYFTVADYVKPPYQIEVTADKKAVFAGDAITFAVKAGFFEGTPVADLDISCNLYAYNLVTSGRGTIRTDTDGLVSIRETIVPEAGAQGETSLQFIAEATLPEIGRTAKYSYARVFVNDIDVSAQASRTGRTAALTVDVNSITLDRLNNGTAAHYYDYIDAPVAGKSISASIYRVYYTKVESGDYYDYIEKRNIPRYRYVYNKELIDSFSIVTDADGRAVKTFTVPDREFESYFAEIACADGRGRNITQRVYIGRDYSSYYQNANTNDYFLDGAKDCYDIGDSVTLTLKRGTDTVSKGNFLFVAAQRGIQSYQAGSNPYSFSFSENCVPNMTVYAYYFNGYNYQSNYYMSAGILYDYSKNDLTLTATADKASYKPGDECSITVTAKDRGGNAKEANVNISVVDEALFALSDYNIDTLASLYRYLGTGLRLASATHGTYRTQTDDSETPMAGGNAAEAAPMAPEPDMPQVSADRGETYLREVFKDTAFFATVRTNERGEAVYTFKLPDNITSWRLTVSGVSNDLYAGTDVRNITVTNPMFLSYTLNDTFLTGDIPTIGVNVYGTSLTGGETVSFEVWDENAPEVKYTASGAAFERIDIPLWEMKNAGANALIIKASVSNGTSDAVKHQYQVFDTYRETDAAIYYDVTPGTVFDVGSGGLTNITFTDRGRGQYLYQLLGMRYVYGDRIEKLAARREADKLLAEYFPGIELYGTGASFDPTRYQRADGGIAVLPYAGSDVVTTVKLMPYIISDVDMNSLKNYLYGVFEGENADNKMCALYGLAMLREPVLLYLNSYSALSELSVKDVVYIALGYLALGETEVAAGLYDARIAPRLQKITPYYRVNTGADNDDILAATSAACILATKLERAEKDGLYQYCIRNYTTDTLIDLERLSHIEYEIARKTGAAGSITYTLFGQRYTRDLGSGGCYTLRIPALNIGEFKLLETSGDVGAVSVYKKTLTETGSIDDDITVRRRYYKENGDGSSSYTFEQGDLIRVQIWIDYSAKALNGSYCVTDYLPSGLEYVSNSAKISGSDVFGYGCFRYCTTDGQKVTFYDYNGRFDRGYLYYYYARVVSPGTFIAEGPLVQNLGASGCFTVGEDSLVVIR